MTGSGTISGAVQVSGTIQPAGVYSPGLSGPATLTVGSLSFGDGGVLAAEVDSATAGTGYDQIIVNGSIDLTGATLLFTPSYVPTVGTTFTLIQNQGTSPITGYFTGLPEGASFTVNGNFYSISYLGGSGNSVVVTAELPPFSPSLLGFPLINGGAAQRSMVTKVAVTFTEPVILQPGAFTLIRQSDGLTISSGGTSPQVVVSNPSGDRTSYILTFSGEGAAVESGSLADGVWVLNINHTLVSDQYGIGMTADYNSPTSGLNRISRLFGDANGDGSVNGADFAVFADAYGAGSFDTNYNSAFDSNGDGVINGVDFAAFSDRYGSSL